MTASDRRGFLLLNGLAPRDRRAILLGLAVLLPVVGYVLGVKPYRAALADVRDRVEIQRRALEGELALLGAAAALPRELERAESEAAVYEDRMVKAASGILAEGELTDFLESAAVRNRVLLEGLRSGELGRGEEPPPGLTVVRLHISGESDLEGVLTFLDEIERSRLFLRVRGMALEPEVARPESDGDENNQSRDPIPTGVVGFQLIVDGFARVEEQGS
jgi:hypothetical protein